MSVAFLHICYQLGLDVIFLCLFIVNVICCCVLIIFGYTKYDLMPHVAAG